MIHAGCWQWLSRSRGGAAQLSAQQAAQQRLARALAAQNAANPTGGYLNIYNDVMDEEARAGMGRASDQFT